MNVAKQFDPDEIASLAKQIHALEQEIEKLSTAKDLADHEHGRATTRLHNLQSKFTKAVESQLDRQSLSPPLHGGEVP